MELQLSPVRTVYGVAQLGVDVAVAVAVALVADDVRV